MRDRHERFVFKALCDPTRRRLLDLLLLRDGQSLTELEQGFAMSRFGHSRRPSPLSCIRGWRSHAAELVLRPRPPAWPRHRTGWGGGAVLSCRKSAEPTSRPRPART